MLTISNLSLSVDPDWTWDAHDFLLPPGKVAWLQGENGVGKSSFLRLIAGFLPANGLRSWLDQPLDASRVFYHASSACAVEDITLNQFFERIAFWYPGTSVQRLHHLFCDWGECVHQTTPWSMLSKGQQKKAMLCTLWCTNRPVWLLDEPLVYLDAKAKRYVLEAVDTHAAHGGVCVMASHDATQYSECDVWKLSR